MVGVKEAIGAIKDLFTSTLRSPATILPAIIMACSLVKRPGLSCMLSTGNILQNMSKRGIPISKLPDGSQNLMNIMVNSVVCEIVRTLKEDINLQVVIEPGALTINGTGANAGGPVNITGTNVNFAKGWGVAQ